MLPIALMLGLGVLESAEMFYLQKHLLAAAQTAARTGTIQNSTTAQVQSALSTYLNPTVIGTDYTSVITGVGSSATGDTLVTVSVTHNFPLFFKIAAAGWGNATVPLNATVTLRHE